MLKALLPAGRYLSCLERHTGPPFCSFELGPPGKGPARVRTQLTFLVNAAGGLSTKAGIDIERTQKGSGRWTCSDSIFVHTHQCWATVWTPGHGVGGCGVWLTRPRPQETHTNRPHTVQREYRAPPGFLLLFRAAVVRLPSKQQSPVSTYAAAAFFN